MRNFVAFSEQTHRISSYSFRGNYSFFNLTLCTMTFVQGYSLVAIAKRIKIWKFWKWKHILKMKAHFKNQSTFWKWKHIMLVGTQMVLAFIQLQKYSKFMNFELPTGPNHNKSRIKFYQKELTTRLYLKNFVF